MILNILDGKLTADGLVIPDIEALEAMLRGADRLGVVVMRSSSLDFADEYTSDPLVLAMVNWLNAGEPEVPTDRRSVPVSVPNLPPVADPNPRADMAKLLAALPDILTFLRYVASGKTSAHDATVARDLLVRAGQYSKSPAP